MLEANAPGLVAGEEVCSRAPGAALSDPAGCGASFPSQRHPPIMIVGPTVTMAWPPMRVPAAASSVFVGDFAEEIFVGLVEFGRVVVHEITPIRLLMLQRFRQVCNVRRDAAGLIARQ
jgi:hypothetical protein